MCIEKRDRKDHSRAGRSPGLRDRCLVHPASLRAVTVWVLVLLLSVLTACTTSKPTPSPLPPASPTPPSRPTATPAQPPTPSSPQMPETVLQVAAAANLSAALPDLLAAFQRQTGIQVTPIVSSSGKLAQQIANGAPYDVFLSADERYVDDLIARGMIDPASKQVYAFGRLALVVNRNVSVTILNVASLAAPEVRRIAIANPTVAPYGRAAQQALERAGIWPLVQDRVVVGESVRHALQFVQSGNADAGLVALSIARVPEVEVYPVREDLYDPVVQAAGIVTRSPRRAAAEQFLAFLTSPEGHEILQRYGYLFPEEQR